MELEYDFADNDSLKKLRLNDLQKTIKSTIEEHKSICLFLDDEIIVELSNVLSHYINRSADFAPARRDEIMKKVMKLINSSTNNHDC